MAGTVGCWKAPPPAPAQCWGKSWSREGVGLWCVGDTVSRQAVVRPCHLELRGQRLQAVVRTSLGLRREPREDFKLKTKVAGQGSQCHLTFPLGIRQQGRGWGQGSMGCGGTPVRDASGVDQDRSPRGPDPSGSGCILKVELVERADRGEVGEAAASKVTPGFPAHPSRRPRCHLQTTLPHTHPCCVSSHPPVRPLW